MEQWAEADPEHAYVSDGTSSYSYGRFRDDAWALARSFVDLGVTAGDRVVVQLPNWNEFFLVYAALSRVGAITIPCVHVYRAGEVGFIVRDSGAVGLVTAGEFRGFDHAEMARAVAAESPGLRFRVVVRGTAAGALPLEELLSGSDAVLPDPTPADDRHLVLYSSGTEAQPKGCLHTWNTSSFLPKQAVVALGLTRDDVVFMPSPVTHALGLTLGVMAPTIAGAAVHLMDVFEPAAAIQRITEHGCTGTASPAAFIRMTLDAFDPAVHDLSGLRFWLTAGAPVPAALVTESAAAFDGCRVVSAYGSSEVMMATVCRPEDPIGRVATSDGSPVPGVELRIVDPATEEEQPTGQDGEIRYRGPGRLLEYWNRPDLTAAATDGAGWWRTGDLGRLDDEGYLRVTGRLKDVIIRGGHNISARQVEEALLQHPAVSDVSVIGLPDARLGEKVCAVLVTRDGSQLTLDEVRHHLVDTCRLAVWKTPEQIEFVTAMPVTATGKTQKYALRAAYTPVAPQ
ncbi:AMP-binding protein [Geodermatophilaceae bacterium NBWT11]|nr:AMP-binding protein [Geodermatophilaceae bacterium NBWT11]